MKTLDEVIKALELCNDDTADCKDCPYRDLNEGGLECASWNLEEGINYLKMYRSDMQMYAVNQKLWEDKLAQKIKEFGDAKDRYIAKLKELDIGTLNEPLSWDELKQMVMKPVWVKVNIGFWAFIVETECAEREIKPRITCLDCTTDRRFNIYKEEYGTILQAYRKERS